MCIRDSVYTVTKLTLYNGESVALTAYYTEPPYVHTIIIRDAGMIEPGDIASQDVYKRQTQGVDNK